jgi:hypothetical protein
MTLLLIYISVALGVSFTCSLLEASLLSITPSFQAHYEEAHPHVGAKLRHLKADVDRPLAAILSLNTMAHTLGAAGAGAEAARIWGSEKLAIASAVLTLLILVLSELIPKTLGAVYWQRFVVPVAYVLPPMIKLMMPLVWLSDLITMAIKRGREPTPSISRAEIAAMAGLAEAGGTIDPHRVAHPAQPDPLRHAARTRHHDATHGGLLAGREDHAGRGAGQAGRHEFLAHPRGSWRHRQHHRLRAQERDPAARRAPGPPPHGG